MKKIKIIWLILGFTGFVTTVNAQSSLTVKASPLYASIKFTDSQDNKLNSEYSGIFPAAIAQGIVWSPRADLCSMSGSAYVRPEPQWCTMK